MVAGVCVCMGIGESRGGVKLQCGMSYRCSIGETVLLVLVLCCWCVVVY